MSEPEMKLEQKQINISEVMNTNKNIINNFFNYFQSTKLEAIEAVILLCTVLGGIAHNNNIDPNVVHEIFQKIYINSVALFSGPLSQPGSPIELEKFLKGLNAKKG